MPLPLLRPSTSMLRVLRPMMVTDLTRQAHAYRRFAKAMLDEGFEPVSENGAPLWKFIRGGWTNRQIIEVRIAPGGTELWIKHEPVR